MTEERTANEVRKAEKRDTIIKGAIKAFQQEGFERASMDLVAECAGASKRTVYNYFESKKELLWAVVEEVMKGQQEQLTIQYSMDESLEAQLGRFVQTQVNLVQDEVRLSIIRLLTSIFVQNKELRDEANQGDTCPPDPLIPWIHAAMKDGRLEVADPELASKVFRGLTEGMINFPALYSDPRTEEELATLKNELIAVFLSRYGSERV